jgi:cystathionine beta-lyase
MFGYSSQACEPAYYEAIVQWFEKKHGWHIKPNEIIYVNGTVTAFKQAILTYTKPGEGVIIQPPVYSPFASTIETTGRVLIKNRLISKDGYYTMDFVDLEEKAADPNTRMLILCSPHNPVGRVWSPEELIRLSNICEENDVLIVTDEIHSDLLRKDVKFTPLAKVTDYNKLITLTAINKTFNLAGLHCSNAIIKDEELRRMYVKNLGWVMPTPFAINALITAYTVDDGWLKQVNDYIDGNIDWLLNFFTEKMPKVKCRRPEGTYILWMDFREYGLSAEEIHDRIYRQANVVLEGGLMFDSEQGAGFERVCVPTPRPILQEAFFRIAKAFEDIT